MTSKRLSQLQPGQTGVIDQLAMHEQTAHNLMQLGLCPGESVRLLRQAPLGGPLEIELMGFRLAIRRADADQVLLKTASEVLGPKSKVL